MTDEIYFTFEKVLSLHINLNIERVLEVGATDVGCLLESSVFSESSLRVGLNQTSYPSNDICTRVNGNSNDMSMFNSGSFDVVLSNATLEHDKFFWKSIGEMRRVLAVGGFMAIGVPGYIGKNLPFKIVPTYNVHGERLYGDYYRYSEQACREVFFDGFSRISQTVVSCPPIIITSGFKK